MLSNYFQFDNFLTRGRTKDLCPTEKAGWNEIATHQGSPTTAPCGQFELLCVQPDPGPGSSSHLVISCSHKTPM